MIFRSVQHTASRNFLRDLMLVGSAFLALGASHAWAFTIDDVAGEAKKLASEKYSAPTSNLPSVFSEMKFVDYQQIRFRMQQLPPLLIDLASRSRGAQRLGLPVQQLQAEQCFQALHASRHARLGEMQLCGRVHDGTGVDHRNESPHVARIHIGTYVINMQSTHVVYEYYSL